MSAAPPRTKRITKNHFFLSGNERLYFKAETEVDFKPTRKKYFFLDIQKQTWKSINCTHLH
jgi:hypothetical protein